MHEAIKQLLEDGYSIELIAENFSGDDCVETYGMDIPSTCHENADCNTCWLKCLKRDLE